MGVHAHIHMIEIMYKVGLIKECLKYLLISLSMGLYLLPYGNFCKLQNNIMIRKKGKCASLYRKNNDTRTEEN